MRSPAVNALPLRNFVSIASGFLLFRVGCAQTLLCVLLYALSGSERTSAPELCQYRLGLSSVSRRMCSDAFMRSPAVAAHFRSGILSVSPRAFFCFASDALRRFYAFSGSGSAVPLRNFIKRRGDSASFSIPVCRMCLKMRSFRAFYPNHFM